MNRKFRPGIAIPTTRGSDGLLCLLFVAACIWAFVFGGGWFRYFFVAAVAGGLVVAGAMRLGRRAADRELDYNRKQE